MTTKERAALAYHIATGRTLDPESATSWAIDALTPPRLGHERRAVEAMIPWLDSLPLDDDTRSRLGLDPDRPEWREVGVDRLARGDAMRVYIAAPFSDPRPEVVAWHVARACLLGRIALECGYAPVVVHPSIAAGVYGDDADPRERERGLRAALEVMQGCELIWVLLRDDGAMSEGVRAERKAWGRPALTGTWHDMRLLAVTDAPALLPAWDALAVRP